MMKALSRVWVLIACSFSVATGAAASGQGGGYTTLPIEVAEALRAQGSLHWSGPDRSITPPSFTLHPPAPNPFSADVRLRYDTPAEARTLVRIYDVAGRLVRALVQGSQPAGEHEAIWNGRSDAGETVATGVYFVHVVSGARAATRKVVVLR